jgi:hypothetical protein
VPWAALVTTREPSSWGERAERSSSAGSIPRRRTIQFADPLSPEMNHDSDRENIAWRPATARAVPSGRAIARFLGTSSPKTIDSAVARTSAVTAAAPAAGPAGSPTSSSTGEISVAIAGWAR